MDFYKNVVNRAVTTAWYVFSFIMNNKPSILVVMNIYCQLVQPWNSVYPHGSGGQTPVASCKTDIQV